MTLREFYMAIGGDSEAALALHGSEARLLEQLRAFPNANDYAGLLPALRESRWEDALACASSLREAAARLGCSALEGSALALCQALRTDAPLELVPPLQEKLARDYRNVVAGINGVAWAAPACDAAPAPAGDGRGAVDGPAAAR